jgi:23S rRNA (cytidine1920-2'-O)/16S rRNA (cytidine1409-2'-O)-methyltransferase
MPLKERIDKLIFEQGLAPSRERAQAYIMAGKVLVNGLKIEKPGQRFPEDSTILIIGTDQPYVSRGGLKLAKALEVFNIDVKNRIALDIGASTGGFTDCLLQHHAAFVFAVDSGYNQLDWKLVTDSRVKSMEKCNFRHLTMETIGTYVDIIVIDVSFISLRKIFGNCLNFLTKGGHLIALIKPQFEAGKQHVKKRGVVNDPKTHVQIVQGIKDHAQTLGFIPQAFDYSPIQGKKSGNREFLIHLIKP